jgi:hypothetical protein
MKQLFSEKEEGKVAISILQTIQDQLALTMTKDTG